MNKGKTTVERYKEETDKLFELYMTKDIDLKEYKSSMDVCFERAINKNIREMIELVKSLNGELTLNDYPHHAI